MFFGLLAGSCAILYLVIVDLESEIEGVIPLLYCPHVALTLLQPSESCCTPAQNISGVMLCGPAGNPTPWRAGAASWCQGTG